MLLYFSEGKGKTNAETLPDKVEANLSSPSSSKVCQPRHHTILAEGPEVAGGIWVCFLQNNRTSTDILGYEEEKCSSRYILAVLHTSF